MALNNLCHDIIVPTNVILDINVVPCLNNWIKIILWLDTGKKTGKHCKVCNDMKEICLGQILSFNLHLDSVRFSNKWNVV